MGTSQAKKVRKEVRAVAGKGIAALNRFTRKRPRWIPKGVWIWFYLPLFPKKHLKYFKQFID